MPVILAMWRPRSGESQFQESLNEKFTRPHLKRKKLDVVTHTCLPSYHGKQK
jgi:hypothetical protein